jgi:hypothetical protein
VKESAHPEHYAARRLGYRKEGSYIPGEIEKLIKTIKVMYKFEQQLHDKIDILLNDKQNKESELRNYINKKTPGKTINSINRKIIYLHDKIQLLERIMYDYKDFQNKLHYYNENFYYENTIIGKTRDIEEFITDKLDK